MNTTLKYILYGLGIAVLGGGAYLLVSSYTTKNDETGFDEIPEETNNEQAANPKPSSSSSTTNVSSIVLNTFPLKQWSRGPLVSAMQSALNQYHDAALKVDGVLGPKTLSALVAAGFPSVIFEDKYRELVTKKGASNQNSESSSGNVNTEAPKSEMSAAQASSIARNLRWDIGKRNFNYVNPRLALIKNVNDYRSVNEFFKTKGVDGGPSRSLVTALFYHFTDSYVRSKIRSHLYRIGLKKRNGKWHLSGIKEVLFNQIKTIHPAKVWNSSKQMIKVPKGTILGEFISANNGVTKFRTLDGKVLYTGTLNIQYV